MNKKIRLARALKALMIITMFSAAASSYEDLPNQIPTHWNIDGVADKFAEKGISAFMIPIIALVLAT